MLNTQKLEFQGATSEMVDIFFCSYSSTCLWNVVLISISGTSKIIPESRKYIYNALVQNVLRKCLYTGEKGELNGLV